jgi:AraC-like DNA-binding protein
MIEMSVDEVRARRQAHRSDGALGQRIVHRTIAYVEAHYAEQISLRDVARELGYSAAHLTYTFSRLTGTAVNSWIIKRRIIAAQRLLSEADVSVATACEAVGFNDLCYFTRQFVRYTGTTPGRYRSAARELAGSPDLNALTATGLT